MRSIGSTLAAALAAAALGCAVLAGAAGAAEVRVAKAPAAKPQLAGDGVVFLSQSRRDRIVRARAGQPLQVLREFTPPSDPGDCCVRDYSVDFSASETHLATSVRNDLYAKAVLAESSFKLAAGPLAGPFDDMFDCGGPVEHPYDVAGKWIAYAGDSCTEGASSGLKSGEHRLVVRDLSQAGRPVLSSTPMASNPVRVDLAGEYAAVARLAGNAVEVAVFDLASGSEKYKAPGSPDNFSLQGDGTLAVSYENSGTATDCRIDWYSLAAPTAHRLGDVCPFDRIKLVDGKVAYQRFVGASESNIELAPLAGGAPRIVATASRGQFEGLDWDGTKVAYVVGGCVPANDEVMVNDLTFDAPVEASDCPISVSKRNLRASKSGIVKVKLTCPEGCTGTLEIRRGGKSALRRLAYFGFAGGSRSVSAKLSSSVRRELTRKGSLAVTVLAAAPGRGSNKGDVATRAVRLLAP